ncbi:MAG TPA: LytTR family DNA-binding domain-containing protein, partial [Thermodesulfobacteriota bacterium]|nr:LytTR family DNA-binding domain-containing protein [Thermodesulfobacteriota bacterium]
PPGPAVVAGVPAGAAGTPEVLALRSGRRFVVVPQSSITYVTSAGGVVTAFTDAGRLWTAQTLSEVERRLDARRFLRIDQSHVINLTRVSELVPWTHQRYRLVFGDPSRSELVLSRDVGRRLRTALGW